MDDIAELERRITFALERVSKGLALLPSHPAQAGTSAAPSGQTDQGSAAISEDLARVMAELAEEKTVTAQLQERLRSIRDKEVQALEALQAHVSALTKQLEAQQVETKSLRRSLNDASAELSALREASQAGLVEPHHLNAAMMTELQALRATRAAEASELNALIASLTPLIAEAQHNA